jgi:ubiquinone/menaquinone biosynthesis C-methylase UbiE
MANRFDQAAAQWDESPRRLRMAQSITDAMSRHLNLTSDQVLLDYGTGTGLIALNLQSCVKKVVAADSSKGMLAVLSQKLNQAQITTIEPKEWSVGQDVRELPKFDVIVSSMTLHHIKDTAAVAKTFYDLLISGGQLAIADLDEENGEFHGDPQATEHHGFRHEVLQEIFERAGFTTICFHEATSMVKTLRDGREKSFSIFLMTGLKPVEQK